ncbi:MAG: hypothetical protein EAX86_09440 [Candidatus Heimdallarchaeota archaeon]|nr:hypothetical protein [Candidatus Heimdallarchaeota archaeon]
MDMKHKLDMMNLFLHVAQVVNTEYNQEKILHIIPQLESSETHGIFSEGWEVSFQKTTEEVTKALILRSLHKKRVFIFPVKNKILNITVVGEGGFKKGKDKGYQILKNKIQEFCEKENIRFVYSSDYGGFLGAEYSIGEIYLDIPPKGSKGKTLKKKLNTPIKGVRGIILRDVPIVKYSTKPQLENKRFSPKTTPQRPYGKKVCPKCGIVYEPSATFCPDCLIKLD